MYGWNTSPTKAEPRYHIGEEGSEDAAAVYEIGSYEITVRAHDGGVTYRHARDRRASDPRAVLPHMTVQDEAISIPITDLVATILSRLDPEALAVALWSENERVRARFVECLVERHNQDGIGDTERRKVLAGVRGAIHSAAVDSLADTMHSLELEYVKRASLHHHVRHINDRLAEMEIKDERGEPLRFRDPLDDDPFRITWQNTGAWAEARAFWRDEMLKRFPGPGAQETAEAPAEGSLG